jgi:hypothetical protein
MSLSTLMVRRGLATSREVEEALARQVLYGADLLTNLLEIADVNETRALEVLAEATGLFPVPHGKLPTVPTDLRALVSKDLAMKHAFVPLARESRGIVIAVPEPLAPEVVQALCFSLAAPIIQRVALAVRTKELLASDFAIPLERRYQRLLLKMEGAPVAPATLPPLLQRSSDAPQSVIPPNELPKISSRAPPLRRELPSDEDFDDASSAAPTQPDLEADARPISDRAKRRSVRPVRRRRGPLTKDVAADEMDAATGRDEVLDLLFEYARQFFDYTVLFTVQSDLAEGWDSFGEGLTRDRVVLLGYPLEVPSFLASARRASRASSVVPGRDGLDALITRDLKLDASHAPLVVPLSVRARIVALLVGVSKSGAIEKDTVQEVATFAELTGAALERIIRQRKLSSMPVGLPLPQAPQGRPNTPSAIASTPSLGTATTPSLGSEVAVYAPPLDVPVAVREAVSSSDDRVERDAAEARRVSSIPTSRPGPDLSHRDTPPGGTAAQPDVAAARTSDRALPSEPAARTHVLNETAALHFSSARPPPPADSSSSPIDLIRSENGASAGPSDVPRASSAGSRSVEAHRPPASTREPPVLPSVIVDVTFEFATLVDRYLETLDEGAHGTLLRAGGAAMPAVMARFPGPLTIPASNLDHDPLPRVVDCGPLLRLIAGQRKVAVPFVLEHVNDPRVDHRLWSTFLFTELRYAEATRALVSRTFDDEPHVRRVARDALRAISELHPQVVTETLGRIALDHEVSPTQRRVVLDTLGNLRASHALTYLVDALADDSEEVTTAADYALVALTRHDFGGSRAAWRDFRDRWQRSHRIEWLIDALVTSSAELAAAAGEELVAITKQDFGYSSTLPPSEKIRAQGRFRDWWNTEGKIR